MGEQPLKWVKSRTVTIAAKRASNLKQMEGDEAPKSGLYGEWQTELYIPNPIIDVCGIFSLALSRLGNNTKKQLWKYGHFSIVDGTCWCKTSSMFHCLCDSKRLLLLVKGIATVAKKLGIDFAEAVTGFEFKHSRCIPVIEGIVVAEDKADVLFDVITSIIIMF